MRAVEYMMDTPPVVCVDLDGVLNTFDTWRGDDHIHPPREGAREFLSGLRANGFTVVVFTVRWRESALAWLKQHGLADLVDEVTDRKPVAHAYVDDRAVCFLGDFDDTLRRVSEFRPFWCKPAEAQAEQ